MTPQEKAQDLIWKFNEVIPFVSPEDDTLEEMGRKTELNFRASQKCALITVEEMLSHAKYIWTGRISKSDKVFRDVYVDYWQQVKEAIETITEP